MAQKEIRGNDRSGLPSFAPAVLAALNMGNEGPVSVQDQITEVSWRTSEAGGSAEVICRRRFFRG